MTPEHTQKCHQEIEETKISGLMKIPEEKSFLFPKLNDKEFHHNCLSYGEGGADYNENYWERGKKKKKNFPEVTSVRSRQALQTGYKDPILKSTILPKYQYVKPILTINQGLSISSNSQTVPQPAIYTSEHILFARTLRSPWHRKSHSELKTQA